jgi:hypothetical protein
MPDGQSRQLPLAARYELNNPPAVAELVEGEVIAINLDTGSYYSLIGPAAEVWNRLLARCSPQEILAGVESGPPAVGELADSLQRFIDALLAEGLIRPTSNASVPADSITTLAPWPSDALRFDHFTDMQDLLLLDPIHDVDERTGWPKKDG